MAKAGYDAIPGAGYRVADLCAVLNAHAWPHQFPVTPEHFRTVPIAPGNRPENAADAAVSEAAGNTALARLSGLVAALDAQNAALARVEAELAAQRERAEAAEAERRRQEAAIVALGQLVEAAINREWEAVEREQETVAAQLRALHGRLADAERETAAAKADLRAMQEAQTPPWWARLLRR